jgi:hypothetical protein
MLMNRRHALRASASLFGVPWQKVLAAAPTSLPDDALSARLSGIDELFDIIEDKMGKA